MAKELNENTGFTVSIKTLVAIGVGISTDFAINFVPKGVGWLLSIQCKTFKNCFSFFLKKDLCKFYKFLESSKKIFLLFLLFFKTFAKTFISL